MSSADLAMLGALLVGGLGSIAWLVRNFVGRAPARVVPAEDIHRAQAEAAERQGIEAEAIRAAVEVEAIDTAPDAERVRRSGAKLRR